MEIVLQIGYLCMLGIEFAGTRYHPETGMATIDDTSDIWIAR
jgi:hypothetical protein